MPKTKPPEFANTVESIMTTPAAESMKKARSAEYFEAWKKVAERDIGRVFGLLPIRGPAVLEEMKEDVLDVLHRITWRVPCAYMTDEEKIAACRVNFDAMRKHAWDLAEKKAPEMWKRVLAATK